MRLLAALISLALASPIAAQEPVPEARPELPAGADPNDWEPYFDLGMRLEPGEPAAAERAFRWSARLDPSRSEPLYALWAAFHLRNLPRFGQYVRDEPRVREDPDVVRADSLRWRAFLRNPFVHRGLDVLLYDQLPGRWADGAFTRALLAYGRGEKELAAERFERLAARNARFRLWAALADVSAGRLDPAAAHLDTLLKLERAGETQRLVRADESKEMYEYSLALLSRARRDTAAARQHLEQALVDNAAFYPARLQLGEMALAAGRRQNAVEEMAQAAELAPGDGYVQYRYGVALMDAGRPTEAAAALRRAAEIEPYYAQIDLQLGAALSAAGDTDGARDAFTRFLGRAPRTASAQAERARRWLSAHPARATAAN